MVEPRPELRAIGSDTDRFIGRQAEIDALGRLLRGGARLVTIHGPGGLGKTRLARQLLLSCGAEHPGGAYACVARGVRDEVDLAGRVAFAVGAEPGPDTDPVITVGHALAHRGASILVLDDCETVVDAAAAAVSTWRDMAPEAVFVTTSREPLGLSGEAVFELGPLSPEDAVTLFSDRAATAEPDAAIIADIVARLDGAPLAIELAAARASFLSLRELRDRLGDSLSLLSATRRDRPARHQSVSAAIEASYEALDEAHRSAFAQCGVFVSGFSLPAAEAVLVLAGAEPIVEVLGGLCRRSLVRASTDGAAPARFALYPLIGRYAAERLREAAAAEAVSDRHAAYFARQASERVAALRGGNVLEAVRFFRLEHENLLAAFRHRASRDAATAPELAHALAEGLSEQGRFREQCALIDEALATSASAGEPALRLRLQRVEALQSLERYREAGEEVTGLLPHLEGDPQMHGAALLALGSIELDRGRTTAVRWLDEARGRLAGVDPIREGVACYRLANAHLLVGQVEQATSMARRARECAKETGSPGLHALAGYARAAVAATAGDDRLSDALLAEAIGRFQALGRHVYAAKGMINRGFAAMAAGRFDDADASMREARELFGQNGQLRSEATAAQGLAEVAFYRREWTRALSLIEDVLPVYEAVDYDLGLVELHSVRGACEAARGRLETARESFETAGAIARRCGPPPFLTVSKEALSSFLDLAAGQRSVTEAALRSLTDVSAGEPLVQRYVQLRILAPLLETILREGFGYEPPSLRLTVDAEGRWFCLAAGERIDLAARPRLGALLRLLVSRRLAAAGVPLTVPELVAGAWPDERVLPKAAKNRVYVSLSALRKLGLAPVLLRRGDGYLLDPDVDLETVI